MNKAEFNAWKAHTDASKFKWTLDPIHNGVNSDEYLFHRGGVDGQYIAVHCGVVTIGNFEGALPHIGEASFTPVYDNAYGSNKEAFDALYFRGGFSFLKEFSGGGSNNAN